MCFSEPYRHVRLFFCTMSIWNNMSFTNDWATRFFGVPSSGDDFFVNMFGAPLDNGSVSPNFEDPGYLSMDDGGIIDYLTGNSQSNADFRRQKFLQDESFAHDIDMQNRQMAYNSEEARMLRMVNAGFNVNLMSGNYGSSSASAPSGGSAPTVNPRSVNVLDSIMNSFGVVSEANKRRAEIDNINADTALKNQDLQLKPLSTFAQINLWNKQADLFVSQQGLTEEDAKFIKSQREFYDSTVEARKTELSENINKLRAEIDKISEESKTQKAMQYELGTRSQLNLANVDVANAQADYYSSATNLNDQNAEKVFHEGIYQSKINDACDKYLDGFPIGVDARSQIESMLASDDPDTVQRGLKRLEGVLTVNSKQFEREKLDTYRFGTKDLDYKVLQSFGDLPMNFGRIPFYRF